MPKKLRNMLGPLASMRLTVVLLGLLVLLVFFGTLAQVDRGIWDVVHRYFRSFVVYVPLQIFLPRTVNVPGEVLFPGGYTVGGLMLVNLLAAHALRFRVKATGPRLVWGWGVIVVGAALVAWFHNSPLPGRVLARFGGYTGVLPLMMLGVVVYAPVVAGCVLTFGRRCGVILIHAALILLIIGEGVTAASAVETQMPIYEGATTSWAQDIREVELAVIDPSDPTHDRTVAVPESMLLQSLRTGRRISHPTLPFAITVEQYIRQSRVVSVDPAGQLKPRATAGFGVNMVAVPTSAATGMSMDRSIDVPSALIALYDGDTLIGRYLVSPHFQVDSDIVIGQPVRFGDSLHTVALRFRRYYRPYALKLVKFNHDLYPGTGVPRNFSSDIRLTDELHHVDRAVAISMNNPLRYRGETYFQSSWIPGAREGDPDRGTVLMVVRNPGWTIPYIACALGTIGMTVQFGLGLTAFLRKPRA
ncbi:MAG: hypothetical protein GC164_04625 [Phycisphaera sp.]|nr:hypothetical protein [Phycisphaera sp.]